MKKRAGLLSTFVVAALVAGLFACLPSEARADTTVDISACTSVSEVEGLVMAAVNASSEGDTVTVTGSYGGADSTLSLALPEGLTVRWLATYTGSVESNLISIRDGGVFELGASSIANYADRTLTSIPITLYTDGADGTVIRVTGGVVETTGIEGIAIASTHGLVEIDGGMVRTSGDDSTGISSIDGTVNMLNGILQIDGLRNYGVSNRDGDTWVYGHSYIYLSGQGSLGFSTDVGEVILIGEDVSIAASNENCGAIHTNNGRIETYDISIHMAGEGGYGVGISGTGVFLMRRTSIVMAGQEQVGVQTGAGSFTFVSGSISTTGPDSAGVLVDIGYVTIYSGSITTSGANSVGVGIYEGCLEVIGSVDSPATITVNGGNSAAVQITGNGFALIRDQTTATDSTSYALHVASMGAGAIIFQAGTANGRIAVDGPLGIIVSALGWSDLTIDHNRTKTGLTIVAQGSISPSEDYMWIIPDAPYPEQTPAPDGYYEVYVSLTNADPMYNYMLLWSSIEHVNGPPAPPSQPSGGSSTPATGDLVALPGLAALAAAGGSLALRRRRKLAAVHRI